MEWFSVPTCSTLQMADTCFMSIGLISAPISILPVGWLGFFLYSEVPLIYGMAGCPIPSYWIDRCCYQYKLSAHVMVGTWKLLPALKVPILPMCEIFHRWIFMIFTLNHLMGWFSVPTCSTLQMADTFFMPIGLISAPISFLPVGWWGFFLYSEVLLIYGMAGCPIPSYWIDRCSYQYKLSARGMVGSYFLL
jgi:hypothetical protein